MPKAKKVLVSVTNDLITDQRVHKVCSSLLNEGYDVTLVGRKGKSNTDLKKRGYKTHRLKLLFDSGPLFYLNYNLSLLFFLLSKKVDIFLSNDLDTLPANYFAAWIKQRPLVYDSHEYFTEVPELVNRKFIKMIWERLEAFFLPKVDAAYTVSGSIANAYFHKYGIEMQLIRNFPVYHELPSTSAGEESGKIIIYQGAVNVHRGIEQMIDAMEIIEGARFWIVGDGDILDQVKKKVHEKDLGAKVEFVGRKPFDELQEITRKATIGVSLEKQIGLNYTFALPNKLFDYIHAGVPVVASKLPEVEKVFADYQIGLMLDDPNPYTIAKTVKEMLSSGKYNTWVAECGRAAKKYNWQNEEKKLIEIFHDL